MTAHFCTAAITSLTSRPGRECRRWDRRYRRAAPPMRLTQSFTEATRAPSRPAANGQRSRVLARLLRPANRRQRHHGNAGRRHLVVGHEEIRHQGHAWVDAVMLEVAPPGCIEHLVVDAELPGEFARRSCEDDIGRITH